MAKSSKKAGVSPERIEEIRRDARSGRNWAAEEHAEPRSPSGSYGATCICGAGQRLQDAALALRGMHGIPTGMCPLHPGGSVWESPPEVWKKIKEK